MAPTWAVPGLFFFSQFEPYYYQRLKQMKIKMPYIRIFNVIPELYYILRGRRQKKYFFSSFHSRIRNT